jgi:riboflavin synthase
MLSAQLPSLLMFTGIVEAIGTVRGIQRQADGMQLTLDIGSLAQGIVPGGSVAVNGACLTVVRVEGSLVTFDVVSESVSRTNLGTLQGGDAVNIERSLRVGGAIDGHLVQGHVDGMARVSRIDTGGGQWKVWFEPPPELMRYMVVKGSVAIDGISLTLVDVTDRQISVAVIPTTLQRTTLGRRRSGDTVNIETDLIARIVVRQLEGRFEEPGPPSLTEQRLAELGFA